MSKLTEEQRAEMRRLRAEGWGYKRLARAFGVCSQSVMYAVSPLRRRRCVEQAARRAEQSREIAARMLYGLEYSEPKP